MTYLVRFGVSLEDELLSRYDRHIESKKYSNRSEAIRDLIRAELVKQEWEGNSEITGVIALVYSHNQRELVNKLMDIQHHHSRHILSTQHIHLDQDRCIEIIVVRGKPKEAKALFSSLRSVKGVKHGGFTMTTTGADLP